jgi:hypothetical protein
MFLFLVGCASSERRYVSSEKLVKMTPFDVLELLDDECCNGVVFEPTDVSVWEEANIPELEALLGDKSEISPAISKYSTIECRGEKYISTHDREVQHLIKAVKQGKYPLAMCSTHDFEVGASGEQ